MESGSRLGHVEISSSEDEPAAMGYESTRQGRSAVARQRRQDRAVVAAGQRQQGRAAAVGQSSRGKAAAAARQGRAAMKVGRPSVALADRRAVGRRIASVGGSQASADRRRRLIVGVGGSQASADRRRRHWRIAGQRQIAGQSLDLSLLPFFGLL